MSCGIDFGTILAPVWHQVPCFVVTVCGNDFSCPRNPSKPLLFRTCSEVGVLKVPWLTLAPFWIPFDSMLVGLVRFWIHFGSRWDHLVIIFVIYKQNKILDRYRDA